MSIRTHALGIALTLTTCASLADLERQLNRAKDLKAQNFIAQNAVDTAQANFDGALALIRSDEAAVQAFARRFLDVKFEQELVVLPKA